MKKEFDAVKSMREIREKLNNEYSKDPGLRIKRLEKIHREYGIVDKDKNLQKVSEEVKSNLYLNENLHISKQCGKKNKTN